MAYAVSGRITTVLGDELVALLDSSWSGSKSAKSKYLRLTIFCVTLCGIHGSPGKGASGLAVESSAGGGIAVVAEGRAAIEVAGAGRLDMLDWEKRRG